MLYVDAGKCSGCGACLASCPQQAISLTNGLASIDGLACDQCGRCLETCPVAAIYPAGEVLPALAQGALASSLRQPPAGSRQPALLSQALNRLVPVILDVAVTLANRWLARRGQATAGLAELTVDREPSRGSPAFGRRLRQRRGRPW
jgi:dissimilatory sulfite reductase (desulfoviridin) alpha/beta subunit